MSDNKMKVLVALDFSKLGEDVITYSCRLSEQLHADVTFIHVIPEPEAFFRNYAIAVPAAIKSHMTELKNTTLKKLKIYVDEYCAKDEKGNAHVEVGDPSQCIIKYAKKNAFDMIVMGFRGHSTFDELLIGSTAQKVLKYAPCSVLIYRPDKAHA